MRKTLFAVLGLLLLAACQEKMEDRAERDARETTLRRCPLRMTDEGNIILERITFDKATHEWCQDFLLDVDSTQTLEAADFRDILLRELKNTPSYKPYQDNGFIFRYVYCRMSAPKDTLIDLRLTPDDYR